MVEEVSDSWLLPSEATLSYISVADLRRKRNETRRYT